MPFCRENAIVAYHNLSLYKKKDFLHGIGPKHLFDQFDENEKSVIQDTNQNLYNIQLRNRFTTYEHKLKSSLAQPWTLIHEISTQRVKQIERFLDEKWGSTSLLQVFRKGIEDANRIIPKNISFPISELNVHRYKELLIKKAWKSESYNPKGKGIWKVPTMLSSDERVMLAWLAEFIDLQGQIVDLGSCLGGTVFLAHGLERNKTRKNSNKVYAYDSFFVSPEDDYNHIRDSFFPKKVQSETFPSDGDFYSLFCKFSEPFRNLICSYQEDVVNFVPDYESIDVLFINLMKNPSAYNHIITKFFPLLIPGHSIVIIRDYLVRSASPWYAILMEKLSTNFEYLSDTNENSVVYLCTSKLTPDQISECLWENMSNEEKSDLLNSAIDMWPKTEHKNILKHQSKYF